MKKQQNILTIIIILSVLALAVLIGSIIYDENVKNNKKAVETIEVPQVAEKEETLPTIEEDDSNSPAENEQEEYIGEEEKEVEETIQKEEIPKQSDEEKAIELAKKEWGEDDTVIFSIEEKKDKKYYIAVKQDAVVIQWYLVNAEDWTISEY